MSVVPNNDAQNESQPPSRGARRSASRRRREREQGLQSGPPPVMPVEPSKGPTNAGGGKGGQQRGDPLQPNQNTAIFEEIRQRKDSKGTFICTYFASGACKKGSECNYSHDPEACKLTDKQKKAVLAELERLWKVHCANKGKGKGGGKGGAGKGKGANNANPKAKGKADPKAKVKSGPKANAKAKAGAKNKSEIECHFYKRGRCTNGDNCEFKHTDS